MTMAFEVLGAAPERARLLLTVEHASNAVPAPLTSSAADAPWLQTHWGWDIGIADVTRALLDLLPARAVLAGFSRLVIDANRPPDHGDLCRLEAEGHALSFNRGLSAEEVARRVTSLHAPYHEAIDAELAALRRERSEGEPPLFLLSMHSFTPVFGVDARWMEAGVLFDDHEPLAETFADALAAQGLRTAKNEPYSGRAGLIYAAQRHGRAHDVAHLELELRQDRIATAASARAMALSVARALVALPMLHDIRIPAS